MDDAKRRNFEFALFPVIQSPSGVGYLSDAINDGVKDKTILEVKTWVYQTLFPRREKFVIDLVALCKDGRILHVEQETSPENNLPIRMLEYSSLLLINYTLDRPIAQIVYYTGDRLRLWDGAEQLSKGVYVQTYVLGFLSFRYVIIDAGAPRSERIENTPLPAAALGLLTRDEQQAVEIARTLADKISTLGSTEERVDAIVYCERIASLRGWGDIFTHEMSRRGMREMSENAVADAYSRTYARAYIDMTLQFVEDNEHISVDEIRPYLEEDSLRIGQLQRLVRNAATATSLDDLLNRADIERARLTPRR